MKLTRCGSLSTGRWRAGMLSASQIVIKENALNGCRLRPLITTRFLHSVHPQHSGCRRQSRGHWLLPHPACIAAVSCSVRRRVRLRSVMRSAARATSALLAVSRRTFARDPGNRPASVGVIKPVATSPWERPTPAIRADRRARSGLSRLALIWAERFCGAIPAPKQSCCRRPGGPDRIHPGPHGAAMRNGGQFGAVYLGAALRVGTPG